MQGWCAMGDPESGNPDAAGGQKAPEPESMEILAKRKKERVLGQIELLKSEYLHFRWKAAEELGDLRDPDGRLFRIGGGRGCSRYRRRHNRYRPDSNYQERGSQRLSIV